MAVSAADTCTTSGVCNRRTLAAVVPQMFSHSGAATNAPPAKEGGGLQRRREAAACPWHRCVPVRPIQQHTEQLGMGKNVHQNQKSGGLKKNIAFLFIWGGGGGYFD